MRAAHTQSYVVVANSSTAQIYQTPRAKLFNGNPKLQLVTEMHHPAGRLRQQDFVSDRPDAMTDPKHHEACQFAKEITDYLDSGRKQHRFDDLIVVSSGGFHELHRALNQKTGLSNTISKQINKDYTWVSANKLVRQLRELL